MGGPGRLQTQDVAAAPAAARSVALTVAGLPAAAPLATPFPVTLRVVSAADVAVGPLRLEPAGGDFVGGEDEESGEGGGGGGGGGGQSAPPPQPLASPPVVFLHGDARPAVPGSPGSPDGTLAPRGTAELTVSLVALAPGIHRLPALRLVDCGGGAGGGRVLDVLSGWVRVAAGGGAGM